jgi:hypothetical protein
LKRYHQHIRLILLLFTVAFAAFGLSLQSRVSDDSGFRVTGIYESELPLEKEALKELQKLTDSTVFKDSVGGQVRITPVDGGYALRISTTVKKEADLETSHNFAVNLLSKNLKRTVVRQKNRALQFLGDSEDEAVLSGPARKFFLRERIAQLESFLKDGTPPSVPLSVDRNSLTNAEQNLDLFPRSDPDYAARVAQMGKEMDELEQKLAKIYLETHKLELDTLSYKDDELDDPTEELELSRRAQELTREITSLEKATVLKRQGELEYSLVSQASRNVLILCWSASLVTFLFALFYYRPKAKTPTTKPAAIPRPTPPPPPIFRVDWSDVMPGIVPQRSGDRTDSFFLEIATEMEHYLGRAPRRFLVLGDSPIESRLAFSLRLAHSLSTQSDRVRLIDFDLTSRRLSKRLGRQNLPGVGDLLVDGGPVDEFYSSIAGTDIQFAPAGCTRLIEDAVNPKQFERILGNDICVIDASSASPLHLVVQLIDVVLCTTQSTSGLARSPRETQVLVAFRDAGLPVWGVSPERNQFFPLL